jgi:hypothetical protein
MMKKYFILCVFLCLIHGNSVAAEKYGKTFESVRVTTEETDADLRAISDILARQISQRCDAKIETDKRSKSQLTIELSIESARGEEGFLIEDDKAGAVRIIGGSARGVLYGVGKFLRTARYDQGVPGQLPLVNFPEISMFGMNPWGGYGTNPTPAHFQKLWDRIKHKAVGGAPYSEGIYEDLNKAIIAGFYWNSDRKAEDIVREYVSFEFSPDVADDMVEVVRIFEQNHQRGRKSMGIKESAIRAFQRVTLAENKLTEEVKSSWRWRIFYLRALIDKEMFERNGKLEGETLKAAFDELTKIYHAENAHSMPIKPPQIK